jgi:hypothetical protein
MSTGARRRLRHLEISRWRRITERKIRTPGRGTRGQERKKKRDRGRMRRWRILNR